MRDQEREQDQEHEHEQEQEQEQEQEVGRRFLVGEMDRFTEVRSSDGRQCGQNNSVTSDRNCFMD